MTSFYSSLLTITLVSSISFNTFSNDKSQQQIPSLHPFKSDGCTMFFDGTLSKPNKWLACCTSHDLKYWYGGTEVMEQRADQELRSCVEVSSSSQVISSLMYYAIRMGHYSPVKHKTRWGWGWIGQTGSSARSTYQALSPEEKGVLKRILKEKDIKY